MENRRENFFKKLCFGIILGLVFFLGFLVGMAKSPEIYFHKQLTSSEKLLIKCIEAIKIIQKQ